MSEISDWLSGYGLQEYTDLFEVNQIGTDILHTLTDDDFKEFDIPLGDRKRLLQACAKVPAAPVSRRQITVVICDLVDSTVLSENTDAEIFREWLQSFRGICKNSIEKFNGYIYQYRGDAAIAYFGYPVGHEKSAIGAAHAALDIISELAKITTKISHQPGLEARIGIATGKVVVGAQMDQGAIQENAVGVTPNLAARLQGLAAPGEIILCPLTHTLIEGSFNTNPMGARKLKGLKDQVEAFSLDKPIDKALLNYIPQNRLRTPLSGRRRELNFLETTWANTEESLKFLLLQGEAGIGKSRIIHEFSKSESLQKHIHLQFFCSPFHQNSALYPVRAQLRRLLQLRSSDGDDAKLGKLQDMLKEYHCNQENILGALASLLGLKMPGNPVELLQPHERRQEYFSAIASLLIAQSRVGNVLIVIEDVQWIDPTTLGLLMQVVDPEFDISCMLLLSARAEFKWPTTTLVQPQRILVEALNCSESQRLVKDAMATGSISDELIEEIVNKTDGIPLYIEETTRAVAEAKSRQQDSGTSLVDIVQIGVPSTLHDSLMARLDGLGSTRKTALAASVIGREFSRRLLELSLNEDAVGLQRDLNILVENGTLKASQSSMGARYQFTHGLLQNIAYDSLLNSVKSALHSQVANALLIHFKKNTISEPELVAHHLVKAGRHSDAADYWKKAGLLASQRGSLQETVAHYQFALGSLDQLELTAEIARKQVSVLSGLAATLLATTSYRSPEVKETANRAIKLCKEHGLALEIGPFLYDIWIGEQGDGKHNSALRLAKEFLDLADRQGESEARMVANRAVAWSEFNLGNPSLALDHLACSRELYEKNLHRDLVLVYGTDQIVGVGSGQVQAEWCLGYPDTAAQTSADTIKAARQSGHVVSIFLAYQYAGCLLNSLCQEWNKTEHYASLLVQLGKENNFPQATLAGNLYHYSMQLRKNADINLFNDALEIIESTQTLGYLYMMPYWFTVLADACLAAKLIAQADRCLDLASDIIDTTGEVWHLSEIYRLRGLSLSMASNCQDTESGNWFAKAISMAQKQNARSWVLRATSSLYAWELSRGASTNKKALQENLSWFTEGLDLQDCKTAAKLLA